MRWTDRCLILRWRSLEETDVDGALLNLDLRREATIAAPRSAAFLTNRAEWLEKHAATPDSALSRLIEKLTVPHIYGILGTAGWVLAAGLGYVLTDLGHDRMINLLAVPLVAILLWNALVMLGSLILECKGDEGVMPGWIQWRRKEPETADEKERKLRAHFRARIEPVAMARIKARARAWLHVGAALLALGSIAGMYAKGWSKEYRAVWESTLLSDEGAGTFFKVVYGPASTVFGVRIPLEDVQPMHRSVVHEARPSEALPWIHLYAGTLALLVIVPRLLLAGLALGRSGKRIEKLWSALDWPGYEARLRRATEGSGEQVTVLMHGWRSGEEPRDRWATAVRERLGGQVRLELATVPSGDEDEFVAGWKPSTANVVVVFNAVTTPEQEVQGVLVGGLHARLRAAIQGSQLVALVDAVALRERRSGDLLASRLKLWEDTLKPGVDAVQVL